MYSYNMSLGSMLYMHTHNVPATFVLTMSHTYTPCQPDMFCCCFGFMFDKSALQSVLQVLQPLCIILLTCT